MPRIGSNPQKQLDREFDPKDVSVCMMVYIPELKGYWEQSLDVLKVCISSLLLNTAEEFDLIVLDNGSCPEVRSFLTDLSGQGRIQLLLLADSNMGKPGGWNSLLPACPGKYIAFTDSDVLFRPGWLTESLRIMSAFRGAGMVTARPFRTPRLLLDELMSATLRYAERDPSVRVEQGALISEEVLAEHWDSLGANRDKLVASLSDRDVLLTANGVRAFAYAGHFQFLTRREVALKVLPLEGKRALAGDEKEWDRRINELGLLRLSTEQPLVRHLGNALSNSEMAELSALHPLVGAVNRTNRGTRQVSGVSRQLRRLATIPRVRKMMERTYGALFAALQADR